jgi:hypothetical protein
MLIVDTYQWLINFLWIFLEKCLALKYAQRCCRFRRFEWISDKRYALLVVFFRLLDKAFNIAKLYINSLHCCPLPERHIG